MALLTITPAKAIIPSNAKKLIGLLCNSKAQTTPTNPKGMANKTRIGCKKLPKVKIKIKKIKINENKKARAKEAILSCVSSFSPPNPISYLGNWRNFKFS